MGFSDAVIGTLADRLPEQVRALREEWGPAARLQDGRHLRRRVRRRHALLLLHLRGGERRHTRARPRAHARHRLRPDPHRPGDRVRLLLRAGRPRPAGRRRPVDPRQLQPGDRLHRLRHLRPALLRAARRGGRARPAGERGRRRRGSALDRPVRRPDRRQPRAPPAARRAADRRLLRRRDRPRRGSRALRGAGLRARHPAAARRRRPDARPGGADR